MKVFLHCLNLLRHLSEGRKGERERRGEERRGENNEGRNAVGPRDGALRTGSGRAKPLRLEGVDLLPRPDWLLKVPLRAPSHPDKHRKLQ
jgi:hypothetical protein